MVSRIEFFCPGCGAPEVPELILREYYHCPNCQGDVPRDKLDRQRRNNYLLAGASVSPFIITPLGGFEVFNPGAVSSAASPTGVDVKSNELFVAVIGSVAGAAAPPTSATLGASDVLTVLIENASNEPELSVRYFNGTMTNPGLQTLTIAYAVAVDCVVCTMFKVTGHAASPIDGSSINVEAGVLPTILSGNTSALSVFNELAIGAFVSEHGTPANDYPTFRADYAGQQRFPQDNNFQSIQCGWATRYPIGKSAINCAMKKTSDASASLAVFTIKPR